jgi:beta-mannosidase
MIEADAEGRYSDNAFDLTAGESRVVRFTPRQPLAEGSVPVFTGYDLKSCQGNG